MNAAARATATAPVFAALGDPQRMLLVYRLSRSQALSITELTEGTTITRQAVTKHLRVLQQAGVARSQRSGRETLWTLDQRSLAKARAQLDAIARQWDAVIDRLRDFVEDET